MSAPYSVSTLAARWGCSKRHISNMVKRGELTGFRIGRQMSQVQILSLRPSFPPFIGDQRQCLAVLPCHSLSR